MSKWSLTLSTTEPYNNVGLIKVRQSNKNSEIFDIAITENSAPYNLSGLRVFFCTHFYPYTTIEKEAQITNPKDGRVIFTMDNDCMQSIGNQTAYFEIYRDDDLMASTQDFRYTIQTSIEKELMDGESYIQRLEDLLKQLKDQMDKSQAEVDKWLEDNRKNIDALMKEMNQFFDDKKDEFSEWFDSVKDILESVDPGGILLSEIVNARISKRSNKTFKTLAERLEYMENSHYTIPYRISNTEMTLRDDNFSKRHDTLQITTVTTDSNMPGLVIATIDDSKQDTFYLKEVE